MRYSDQKSLGKSIFEFSHPSVILVDCNKDAPCNVPSTIPLTIYGQETIDGVEYNVVSCVIDDYIIGVYPNLDSKLKELQEKIDDLESRVSDLED